MSTTRARIDGAGRLLIPAELRRQLDLRPGDLVSLEAVGRELRLRSYSRAVREAQAIIAKYIPDRDRSLVDELIEERHKEAER
jgi:AbrB family looped-hinge helix DNA binding protein